MKRKLIMLCASVMVFSTMMVGCQSTLERQNDAIEKAADKQIEDAQKTLKAIDELEKFLGQ